MTTFPNPNAKVTMLSPITPGSILEFDYRNHRDEWTRRTVTVSTLYFGVVQGYYENPQFLLSAWCHDRKALRTFALGRMIELKRLG